MPQTDVDAAGGISAPAAVLFDLGTEGLIAPRACFEALLRRAPQHDGMTFYLTLSCERSEPRRARSYSAA
jgi:hypothetical protein